MHARRSPVPSVLGRLAPAFFALASFAALLPAPAAAQDDAPPDEPAPREVSNQSLQLDLVLPPLEKRRSFAPRGQIIGNWEGELDGARVSVLLYALPRREYGLDEPDKVIDLVIQNQQDRGGDQTFRFGEMKLVPGKYGEAPYCAVVGAEVIEGTGHVVADITYIGGVSKDDCYVVQFHVDGKATPAVRAAIDEFVAKGLKYRGVERNPQWTGEEVEARWKEDAPDELADELDKVLRTDNYIIMTNSAGAKAFARAMEENYAKIKKLYPFREVAGRRLMPVFIFRLPEEYYAYLEKNAGWSRAQAARTKGVASGDWYATWYESPKDSVHIHEATHQIFANRLLLSGGGSWFQEGVAEYIEKLENSGMNEVENMGRAIARRGEGVPLRQLFTLRSLVFSSEQDRKTGGSAAGDAYVQSASVIAFVRNDKRTKAKFQDFIKAMGSVRRSDLPAIERALEDLFGWSLEEFEAAWKKHYE